MEAVHGGSHPGLVEWTEEVEWVWTWHQALAARRRIAEAHYLLNKPTLIAPALLPFFLTLEAQRERFVDDRTGKDAKLIREALGTMGPTPSMTLRRSVGMEGKVGHSRFDRAIAFLMRSLSVLKVGGMVETGTWTSAVFDLAERAFPGAVRESAGIEPGRAREKVLWTHLRAAVVCDLIQIHKLLDWPETDFDNSVQVLLRQRKARLCSAPGISRQALIAIP